MEVVRIEKNRSIEFLDREKAVQTKLDDLDKKIILERINSKGGI